MLSRKQCEKKIREISALKQKQIHSREEQDKIKKEQYYTAMLQKTIEQIVLPDDVKFYILEFVDPKVRMKYLRAKYTPKFVTYKLSLLPKNELTIKLLFSCVQYIKFVFTQYLRGGDIYRQFGRYVDDKIYYHLDNECTRLSYYLQSPHPDNLNFYSNLLISIIVAGIKNYSKMYNYSPNIQTIQENNTKLLKLFARIASFNL